ncbi:hypothetical protein CLV63_10179 [Murinocardiopsis flavida]|uniref:Uncharacterized protein n=1 Tax=Murinocardiopsis flavida TaxID=645275 RepID=A0A2P8DTS0_9ACTN|nr:hypothetical protein [Murinocardiopsis flavida]PSL00605.1 hypothetical protein CLV63_10179 [Murinocardiopsis flavida]
MARPNGAASGAKKVVFNEADRTRSGPLIGISLAEAERLRGTVTALRAALAYAGTAGERQAAVLKEHVRVLGEAEHGLRGLLEQAGGHADGGSGAGAGALYDDLVRLFDAAGSPRPDEAARHRPAPDGPDPAR